MKVQILEYCQEMIDGRLTVLDANRIIDISNEDASRLIINGVAQKIILTESPPVVGENKMVNILYKKRGRPRKED
jgi:hypothetical protein